MVWLRHTPVGRWHTSERNRSGRQEGRSHRCWPLARHVLHQHLHGHLRGVAIWELVDVETDWRSGLPQHGDRIVLAPGERGRSGRQRDGGVEVGTDLAHQVVVDPQKRDRGAVERAEEGVWHAWQQVDCAGHLGRRCDGRHGERQRGDHLRTYGLASDGSVIIDTEQETRRRGIAAWRGDGRSDVGGGSQDHQDHEEA